MRGLAFQVGCVATTLDHEIINDAVEDRTFVEAIVHVLQEIGHRQGCPAVVQFDDEIARRGFHADPRKLSRSSALGECHKQDAQANDRSSHC